MHQSMLKVSDEAQQEEKKDYLLPILKKFSLEAQTELDEETALYVKNEALKNLKERLLSRADIITKRLNEEQKKLELEYNNMRRKNDTMTPEDETKYDNNI